MLIQGSEQEPNSLTIQSMILAFSKNLARMETHKPKGKELYGWEFMALATDAKRTTSRQVKHERDSVAWVPLLDSLTCLFCSELVDAIVG